MTTPNFSDTHKSSTGGHFELAPPLPNFWEVHWSTLGEI